MMTAILQLFVVAKARASPDQSVTKARSNHMISVTMGLNVYLAAARAVSVQPQWPVWRLVE